MSTNEKPNNFPITLLDEKKSIVALNKEHQTILEQITKSLGADKYNSIVTMENYKVMKESATELNKTSILINKFKIEKVKLETEDIESFKSNCKLYCDSIQSKRETILLGLSTFEEETKKQVLIVSKEYMLDFAKNKAWLREEFINKVNVSDMTLTGYMTANGAISKKGRDEVEKRVNEQLSIQNKVDLRLSNLENECLKNGIAVMSKEHVQGFLHADDETYKNRLDALIGIEVKRAEAEKLKIEAEAKIKAEKDAKEKVLKEQEAEKAELEARYLGRIRTADKDELLIIGIELQSYSGIATYDLKQKCGARQKELETPKVEEQIIDETLQEEHLKDIAQEPIKKQEVEKKINSEEVHWDNDGKVLKTISCSIKVPITATDEQIKDAVFGMIQSGQITAENFEVN